MCVCMRCAGVEGSSFRRAFPPPQRPIGNGNAIIGRIEVTCSFVWLCVAFLLGAD